MIPRYADPRISAIFSDEKKLERWQAVELAVIKARVDLGLATAEICESIETILLASPPDVAWWLARDKVVHHDLNAFVEERTRLLPPELTGEFHRGMTSFDTEDPAFSMALLAAGKVVSDAFRTLLHTVRTLALDHGETVMLRRTHGQAAKLGTFGGRVLTWHATLAPVLDRLHVSIDGCSYSRISGAVGTYGGTMTPAIEARALKMLGLTPFYGATQIMPRSMFAFLAQDLLVAAEVLGKIALDIRLMARSGRPLVHEPFGKLQKGSSAMPHKKNPIITEQVEGLVRLVRGYVGSIVSNIPTWEERAIEQSSVERVSWPDLFHTILRIFANLQKVLSHLVVYPEHMLLEVVEARGTYASDEAKTFLADVFGNEGIAAETAYRIVQLASFNVTERAGREWKRELQGGVPLALADSLVCDAHPGIPDARDTIMHVIAEGRLEPSPSLEASKGDVEAWNGLLKAVFAEPARRVAWRNVFTPSRLIAGEAHLFSRHLDV